MSDLNSSTLKKKSVLKKNIAATHDYFEKRLSAVGEEYSKAEIKSKRYQEVIDFFESLDTDMKQGRILVSEIDLSQNDRQLDVESQDFIALVESIQSEGLLQRPVLTLGLNAKKPFLCVAGHRRISAMMQLGYDAVPVNFMKPRSESNIRLARMTENLVRENLKPLELAQAVFNLKNELSETTTGVARVLKKDRSSVTRLLKIAEWPTKAKAIAREKNMTLKQLDKIAKFSLTHDELIAKLNDTSEGRSLTCISKTATYKKNMLKLETFLESKQYGSDVKSVILDFLEANKIKGWH